MYACLLLLLKKSFQINYLFPTNILCSEKPKVFVKPSKTAKFSKICDIFAVSIFKLNK